VTTTPAPITRVRIEVDRGGDGAFAAVEDGDYGMVELRLRGRLNQPVDEAE
jgi:hypothetical protein